MCVCNRNLDVFLCMRLSTPSAESHKNAGVSPELEWWLQVLGHDPDHQVGAGDRSGGACQRNKLVSIFWADVHGGVKATHTVTCQWGSLLGSYKGKSRLRKAPLKFSNARCSAGPSTGKAL